MNRCGARIDEVPRPKTPPHEVGERVLVESDAGHAMWVIRLSTGEWAVPLACTHSSDGEACACIRAYVEALSTPRRP